MRLWCKEGKLWLNQHGKKVEVTEDSKAKLFLLQRISMAVQRGKSACVVASMPAAEC